MRLILFVPLLFAVSCGVKKNSSHEYGKTTKTELIQVEGEPIKEEKISIDNGVIFHYADDVKYQLKNDVVNAGFKNPSGDQKQLIYWKHKFKDCETLTRELPAPADSHTEKEIELSCASEGVSVIYTKNSSHVLRVIEYEKK